MTELKVTDLDDLRFGFFLGPLGRRPRASAKNSKHAQLSFPVERSVLGEVAESPAARDAVVHANVWRRFSRAPFAAGAYPSGILHGLDCNAPLVAETANELPFFDRERELPWPPRTGRRILLNHDRFDHDRRRIGLACSFCHRVKIPKVDGGKGRIGFC